MLVSRNREKLLNAIIYFAHHTNDLGKIKLFKLLYLLDFEHFRQTGRSVTGLDYTAWKFGPAPNQLMQEWEEPEEDFSEACSIVFIQVFDYVRQEVHPKRDFDDSYFTRRELSIMGDLVDQYSESLSKKMIDITHDQMQPWAKVWRDGKGAYDLIPYDLIVEDDHPHREAVIESARDYEAINRARAH